VRHVGRFITKILGVVASKGVFKAYCQVGFFLSMFYI